MNIQFSYDDFVSRNTGYITSEIQEKIKQTKLVFFGTGLSSLIAEHCARLGFVHMHLNDGDNIELSNLNRQAFTLDDLETYKSEAVKKRILAINPACNISIGTHYIQKLTDYDSLIKNGDIIINTVDCNKTYFDIIEHARENEKLVLCPFNPGFSGLVIAFNKNSSSSHEMFDLSNEKNLDDVEISRQLFQNYPEIKTLRQINTPVEVFLQKVITDGYFPQINIGALLTTAIVLTTILKFLKNEPVTLAPKISYLNGYIND